ncbi:MAG: ankyrin repeat domain-containing protein, partial [Rickettsiales bacterium]|nr:ankyrin repeat domain-containing protein [Rickettsiales bacterium]
MTRNLEAQDNFEIRFIQNCLHQIQNGNIEYFTSRDPSYFMQIVNKLFYFDEDSIDQIDETQKVKYNIFLFSIYKNQVKITDYLYDSGANWKQSLFLLIENNFFDKIENFCNFLERNKLNIDFLYSYKDLNMNTPLMFAYQNNKEHISSFLEKKYNRNLVLKGKKKLKFKKLYCSNENPSQIEVFEAIVGNQLINEKATNLDFHLNFENSWSPFLLAVYLKNIPITNFLKNQYVDINHKSNQNNTALHIAVLNNDFEMVRLL